MDYSGVGIDIVDTKKFNSLAKNRNNRFLLNNFSVHELDYCFSYKDPVPHLAANFAAKELPNKVGNIFSQYGFNFYDFSNNKIVGANDKEFIDPKHATDKTYLRMSIYMTERDEGLSKYFDLNKLKLMLKNTQGDFLDF